jgi:hypothetical protein
MVGQITGEKGEKKGGTHLFELQQKGQAEANGP